MSEHEFPDYEILGSLGEGGMGEVFHARQISLDREVALKVISREARGDAEYRKRFRREYEILLQLSHPNLVQVHDARISKEGSFIAMELVEGVPLHELPLAPAGLDVERSLGILEGLASALTYLHGKGVVHRDLKPANVLVTPSDSVKVLDFGLARGDQQTMLTRATQILGTMDYMAPEVLTAAEVSYPADVYAMGVMAYQVLSGRLPILTSSFPDWQRQVIESVPPPLSSLRSDLPSGLDTLLEGMLAKDPGDRPAAEDVLDRLESLRKGAGKEVEFVRDTPSPGPMQPEENSGSWSDGFSIVSRFLSGESSISVVLARTNVSGLVGIFLLCLGLGFFGAWYLSHRPQDLDVASPAPEPSPSAAAPVGATQVLLQIPGPHLLRTKFLLVPGGRFRMGSDDPSAPANQKPSRLVRIEPFYMAEVEVTQSFFQEVMGQTSFFTPGPTLPADLIGPREARTFCERLSALTGRRVRLPSEAEWEYACRAGTSTRYYFGDSSRDLVRHGWVHTAESPATRLLTIQPVGRKPSNPLGLKDLYGNVMEWCEDLWHPDYAGAPSDRSPWIEGGKGWVLRGGACNLDPSFCTSRARYRADELPFQEDLALTGQTGLRLVMEP